MRENKSSLRSSELVPNVSLGCSRSTLQQILWKLANYLGEMRVFMATKQNSPCLYAFREVEWGSGGGWMSGGLWRPVAACGGLWRPVAACGSLWQPVARTSWPLKKDLQLLWLADLKARRLGGLQACRLESS